MRLKINVSELMGKRKITQNKLSKLTGIRPATISAYYYETVKRMETEHVVKLCEVLECTPADLFGLVPDEEEETK